MPNLTWHVGHFIFPSNSPSCTLSNIQSIGSMKYEEHTICENDESRFLYANAVCPFPWSWLTKSLVDTIVCLQFLLININKE